MIQSLRNHRNGHESTAERSSAKTPARPRRREHPGYAVLGAGNGGRAMAAVLALQGFRVHLWNRTFEHVKAISDLGGLYLSNENDVREFARIGLVTSDISKALEGISGVMVVVPSSAHADVARLVAPHLADHHVVVLHPGRTLGALEFKHVLRLAGNESSAKIAEAQTLLFASRSRGLAETKIFRTKYAIPVAALPATDTLDVLDCLAPGFPQFVAAENTLQTSLGNMGAIFHPALTLLNAGWIEATKGDFQFYVDGVTPSIARVLEALDRERVTIAASLGVGAASAIEWLESAYRAGGRSLYEAMHNNPGYAGIKAPRQLMHRYIFEEIPYSLVPIISLGRRYGVACDTMATIVRLASVVHGVAYERRGRTLESLGLDGFSRDELRDYVDTGAAPDLVVGSRPTVVGRLKHAHQVPDSVAARVA